jgi:type IV secretory pathway VirJ component
MDETSQAIGQLQAKVETLETEVRQLRDEVARLVAVLNAGKGGWRTLIMVGTAATALGAAVTTVIGWFVK